MIGVGCRLFVAGVPVASGPAPTITAVSRDIGQTAGGEQITITGTNLENVQIGGSPASLVSNTGSTLVCTTPALALGTYNISVQGNGQYATLTNGWTAWDPAAAGWAEWLDVRSLSSSPIPSWAGQQNVVTLTAAGAAQPALVAANINGIATPRFDGIANVMQATALGSDILTATDGMIIGVVRIIGRNNVGVPSGDGIIGSAGSDWWGLTANTAGNINSWAYASGYQAASTALALSTVAIVAFRHTGGQIGVRVGNGAWVEAACGNLTLTNGLCFGGGYSGTAYLHADVGDLAFRKTYDSAQETLCRRFLAAKFGITL